MLSKFLVNDLNVEENVEKRGGRKKERSEREREKHTKLETTCFVIEVIA